LNGRSDIVAALRAAGCVYAEEEAAILLDSAHDEATLWSHVDARAAGRPLEHVVGWAALCGRRYVVAPGVFVPRRRSELLVELAAGLVRPGDVVVELCCGAGAIAAAIAAAVPGVIVHAADIDPVAVACARRNLPPAQVHEGDLYDALPPTLAGAIDLLVANAPYVPTTELGALPAEARLHESPIALDGGLDGLDVQRRVALGSPAWLAPAGRLIIETSTAQSAGSVRLCVAAGLAAHIETDDDLDATAVVARYS
jgi:release factor glutamine methyltransferase